jgi:hypothetical protein
MTDPSSPARNVSADPWVTARASRLPARLQAYFLKVCVAFVGALAPDDEAEFRRTVDRCLLWVVVSKWHVKV